MSVFYYIRRQFHREIEESDLRDHFVRKRNFLLKIETNNKIMTKFFEKIPAISPKINNLQHLLSIHYEQTCRSPSRASTSPRRARKIFSRPRSPRARCLATPLRIDRDRYTRTATPAGPVYAESKAANHYPNRT